MLILCFCLAGEAMSEAVCASRIIDYVRFTFKGEMDPYRICKMLGLEFVALGYGMYRYRQGLAAAGRSVQVFYEGCQEDMGVHVQISGEGCRLIEAQEGFPGWREIFTDWLSQGATFTRVDLALDDPSGTIQMETVRDAMYRRDYASTARTGWQEINKHTPHGTCTTIYLGKRAGATMMRCYDKGMQLGEGRSWLRFEFEFQAKRAHALAETLAYEGWDKAVGAVRSFVEFKDPEHETTDRTRRRPAAWWDSLIACSKHRLTVVREACTSLVKLWAHVQKQWKRTAHVMLEAHGGDISWFLEIADKGRRDLGDRHRHMILAARAPGMVLA